MPIDRRSLLAAPLAAALAPPAAAQGGRTIDIRIGAGHPPAALWISTLRDSFMPNVMARVQRETPHRIRFIEGFGGSVCRPGDCLEAVETGLLEIAEIQVIFEPAKLMAHNFTIYVPFGPPDAKLAASCVRETYRRVPRLAEILERNHRQVYLAASVVGNYGIVTNFTWNELPELRGRKIAAAGPNIPWLQGQNVGVVPVQSNLNEAYTAMQTGVYDGWIMFPDGVTGFRLHELSRQYVRTDFGAQGNPCLTANVQSWRRLPPEVQRIIRDEAEKWSDYLGELTNQRAEESFEIMRRQGLVIRTLSEAEKRAWAHALPNIARERIAEMRRNNQPAEAVETYVRIATEAGHRFPRDWLNS
ncbi:MAG: TRAP transporter substrate-binding protein DctP [Rhodovarius sp.]|nr:TRAP transporter substrate-binding protein DctP [Rhodovarius sp.]MDW8313876.1 TRAP transporter substrate-binding protein DctP [Rhodovarius sp.]